MMKSLDELLDSALAHAERVLINQEGAEIVPTFAIQFKSRPNAIVAMPWSNDREKILAIKAMRGVLRELYSDVINYSFLSEAWLAEEDHRHPMGLQPSDRMDRREAVLITAFDKKGGKMRIYEIKRDAKGMVAALALERHGAEDKFSGRLHNLLADQ